MVKGNGSWIHIVRGYVNVRLTGREPEAFLNAAAAHGIELRNIRFLPGGKALTFGVSVPEFRRLKPLLKETGCRTRIVERGGWPFQSHRLFRRKMFGIGLFGFVAVLFVLSTFVWEVDVEGNERIPEARIRQAAADVGIYPFQWSPRLRDAGELASRLSSRLPETAWVGVEKRGTKVTVTVVESSVPEPRKLTGPRDLVATVDAVVTRIVAENGRPQVARNDRVRKGDVLISGRLGNEERSQWVVSKGEVRGLVWHEYEIVSPLVRKEKGFTGEAKERTYLVLGNRALQLDGYGGEPFAKSEIRSSLDRLQWRRWTLPFGVIKEKELEVAYAERRLTPAEAREAGLAQAREEIRRKWGADAVIVAEKILHEQSENGKVRLNVLYEVDQSIATERPIVRNPG